MPAALLRDLTHAVHSLSKARAFTFVCVVSLGIGMAPVIAIPYVSRVTTLTPPGVSTEELVQLVTTSVGPHQQTEQWSYPDYVDLRDANTGITLIGWIGAQSEVTFQATGGSKMGASTMFVPANYFKTLGVALARGAGFDASADDPLRAEPVVISNGIRAFSPAPPPTPSRTFAATARRSGCSLTAGCRLASAFGRRVQRLPGSPRNWPGRIRRPTSSRPGSPGRTTRSAFSCVRNSEEFRRWGSRSPAWCCSSSR